MIKLINTDWRDDGGYGGVGYYRIMKPAQYLDNAHALEYKDLVKHAKMPLDTFYLTKVPRDTDAVIIKHLDDHNQILAMVATCMHRKTPLILDLDDNLFEIRPDQPAYAEYGPGTLKQSSLGALLCMVNGIIVSTPALKEYYAEHLKKIHNLDTPIFVCPNYNDINDWKFVDNRNEDRVVIGWHGSITHDSDLIPLLPVIDKLMDTHKDLYFEIMGGIPKNKLKKFFKNVRNIDRFSVVGGTKSWEGFTDVLMENKWDIGIAPLIDDKFNEGKSHIKWMEYAMKKIPTVASNVRPYSEWIEDGKTGFLVDKDWETTLEKLIIDKDLRYNIGEQAYEKVKNDLQYADHINEWKEAIEAIKKAYTK
jgi:glycosyltransferase involved in cell wall biosynthesis